jgi:hypothetical protein
MEVVPGEYAFWLVTVAGASREPKRGAAAGPIVNGWVLKWPASVGGGLRTVDEGYLFLATAKLTFRLIRRV